MEVLRLLGQLSPLALRAPADGAVGLAFVVPGRLALRWPQHHTKKPHAAFKTALAASLTLVALLAGTNASAQVAGTFSARAGVTHIAPQVSSGNLSTPSFPGTTVDVGSASALTGGLNYMITDHWACTCRWACRSSTTSTAMAPLRARASWARPRSCPPRCLPSCPQAPYPGAVSTWLHHALNLIAQLSSPLA